ncbi:MAG: homoserine dehydrogenase [Thermomicrobiales bacterium]|nr:homoserine dehydrogenase [Thermomicrobiales bacterium]
MSVTGSSVRRINLVQLGVGLIGCTTIEQVLDHRARWQRELGLDLVYRGLIDFDGAVACDQADGYSESTLRRVIEARKQRRGLAEAAPEFGLTPRQGNEALDIATSFGPTIVMDTAVGEGTAELDAQALSAGAGLVFSNKAPFAMPHGTPVGDAIWACAGPLGLVRYETTCGAGLPVISTLRSLIDTGDEVIEIVGALSGTFGAIFSDVANGKPFSAAVRSAKEQGYTEPDPRDDLSGLDVARKALILARTMGRRVDLSELEIENLVPEAMRGLSVDDFLDRASALDAAMAERAAEAKARGKALKYVATVRPDGPIAVGLRAIGKETVLGALQGPENIISFRTKRYDAYPLNVTGPGAGAAVTAAGVVADVLALATGPLGS